MTASTIFSSWYRLDDPRDRWSSDRVETFFRGLADHAPRRSGFARKFLFAGHAPLFAVATVRTAAGVRRFVALPSEEAEAIAAQFRYDFPECSLVKADPFPTGRYVLRRLALEKESFYPLSLPHAHDRLRAGVERSEAVGTGVIAIVSDVASDEWRSEKRVRTFLTHPDSPAVATILVSRWWALVRALLLPFAWFYRGFRFLVDPYSARAKSAPEPSPVPDTVLAKLRETGLSANVFFIEPAKSEAETKARVLALDASVAHLCDASGPLSNRFRRDRLLAQTMVDLGALAATGAIVMSARELAELVAPAASPAVPTKPRANLDVSATGLAVKKVLEKKTSASPASAPLPRSPDATPIGLAVSEPQLGPFGILPEDRRRHVYLIGKTGTGKTTLLTNMILDDIARGKGVALVDPHGDVSRTILEHIPKRRTNDVIFFDPSDVGHPVAFNLLETVEPRFRPAIASGIVSVFKRLYGNSWGPRLEYILRNSVLSLLPMPDATLMSIVHLLTSAPYRERVVERLDDPVLRNFWINEFGRMDRRQMTEAVSPILNKVGQFLSNPLLRNILLQPKSAFSLRWAMDRSKILILRLPKGTIGEDVASFLGSLFVTRLQIEAMSRADIPEKDRKEFSLYVDEFQNFATESFSSILSEARKFSLSLVLANQYVAQMPEEIRQAVFGNVGTILSFQVGPLDAPMLERVMNLGPNGAEKLQALPRFHAFVRLSVDGMGAPAFEARTLPPIQGRSEADPGRRDAIERVSRERYAADAAFVEKKIAEHLRAIESLEPQNKQ